MSDSDELANRMEIHRFSKDYEEEGFDESGYSLIGSVSPGCHLYLGLCLGLHLIQPGVVISNLFQVCPGDFSREHRIITSHIRLRINRAMFEFYLEPASKLLQVDL